jgi:hypothetical protein
MKKVFAIIAALVIFLIILIAYIIPQQGGLISSTSQQASELAQSDYKKTLPIQLVDLGTSGRFIFIVAVMLSHVLFANLHPGRGLVPAGHR